MKIFVSAVALTVAFPALALAQAGTPADHSHHHGQMQHEEHKHSENCCKDKAKCREGEKKDCCEKHKSGTPAPEGHEGHQGH